MKKDTKKLALKREGLKTLTTELQEVAGGRAMDNDPSSSYFSGFP